jgi:hypothetical protein
VLFVAEVYVSRLEAPEHVFDKGHDAGRSPVVYDDLSPCQRGLSDIRATLLPGL